MPHEHAPQFTSCTSGTPLVAFGGEATASVLNYNLPASTAFVMRCFVPVDIPSDWLIQPPANQKKPNQALDEPPSWEKHPPRVDGSVLDRIKNFRATDIREKVTVPDIGPDDFHPIDAIAALVTDLSTRVPALGRFAGRDLAAEMRAFDSMSGGPNMTPMALRMQRFSTGDEATPVPLSSPINAYGEVGLEYNPHELVTQLAAGNLPVFNRGLYGRERATYVPASKKSKTRLFIIEDYEIASFLGDYGAGRTVKTFSLLPGERTTITVKSWKSSEVERSRGENVLDSFSNDSSQQFEQMADQELKAGGESQDAWSSGWSHKDTDTTTKEGNVSAGFSVKIGPFGGGASGGYKTSSTDTSENNSNGSTSSSRKNTVEALSKAMDRHVNQSSSARKFEVNTESKESSKTTEGSEESVVRELANINHSRVLNFVFRQLTQEFITITHLKDVAIGGTFGEIGDAAESRLDGIDAFLKRYVVAGRIADVRRLIVRQLSAVYDFEGTPRSFVERVNEEYPSIEGTPAEKVSYYRKRKGLTQQYRGKDVDGIILHVAERILVTDALVVDALLGQGEALDCYNMRLQDAAGVKAEVANDLSAATVAAIEGLPADAKAEAIAKISYPPASPIVS